MPKMDEVQRNMVRTLYQAMPGAPRAPNDDGLAMWGEVEGNEHWRFCETVVEMIVSAAQAYSR